MLIAIEGIDGSGKTTLANSLEKELNNRGISALSTHEPFTKEITEMIRIQGWKDPVVLTLLFAADRAIHLSWISTRNEKIIILDRYIYSTIAYQSTMGLDDKWIISVNEKFPKPQLTILLDLPEEIALKRIKKNDSFNFSEKINLLGKIRKKYIELSNDGKTIILDATETAETLTKKATDAVLDLFS
ncbi:thymidylate kinase [Candidatus Acidianus copahuensis]|uniref:Probable thymidylate kinase n=1 Tax=Candidatus Acidianus copahuensis TaxID=1160895 RepID=A0A031LN24_9CREN|nr:dTMP kinase [Candidatus Acidianus copahuensis]EZQ02401.1 thymidylate kinase [Candidatus Acidianus copahuensis]